MMKCSLRREAARRAKSGERYGPPVAWRVQNRIGADGLPVNAWARVATHAVHDDVDVQSAEVVATFHADEVDVNGSLLAGLEVDVLVDAVDGDAAVKVVRRAVLGALFDVVGDREVGWSEMEWVAERIV